MRMGNGALHKAGGILVMGLNGCGKSTLGRALAHRLGSRFMDAEDYYFPAGQDNPYAESRTREEALSLLREDVKRHPRFVYASVCGPRDEGIEAMCALAVVLTAPKDVRQARIDARDFKRFGGRVTPGGDMFGQQKAFRAFVSGRSEAEVEAHLSRLACPVLRLDGTRPVGENVEIIAKVLRDRAVPDGPAF